MYALVGGMSCDRSLPLPFPGSEAILAAILAGGTPALPGGVNGYNVMRIEPFDKSG